MRFFIRSYSRRSSASKKSKPSGRISQAAEDAAHGVDREVDSLGKAAENGVGDLANNVMNKINGAGTPKSSERRRNVSATIERKVRTFEKSDDDSTAAADEGPITKKNSQESLRVSVIRKKASEEHNKLRSMFEDGQAFGRSVDHSNIDSIFRTKPNNTESHSRLLSADEEDKGNWKGVGILVDPSKGAGIGAEQRKKENLAIDGAQEDDKEDEETEKVKNDSESQHVSISNDTKEEFKDTQRNDSHQIPANNSPDLVLPNDHDTNDPFIDPLPLQKPSFPPSPSRSTSEPTVRHLSSIPVLSHSSISPSTLPPTLSPTRPSKIPKLTRTGSPPKRSATSPVISLLTPAKTTAIASTNGANGISATVSLNGIMAGGGAARDRGK